MDNGTHVEAGTTVGEMVRDFHLYNRSINKAEATCEWHKHALKPFLTFMGEDKPVGTITAAKLDHYRLYLLGKSLSVESCNNYLRSLKALLNWAVDREYLTHRPAIAMLRKDPTGPKATFTEEEFAALLAAAEEEATPLLRLRAKALLLTLYTTGLRASELCQARWQDIHHLEVDGQPAHVLLVAGAKRGGCREIPLLEDVWQAIKAYREELAQPHGRGAKTRGSCPAWLFTSTRDASGSEPLTVGGLRTIFNRLGKRGQVHSNPHKFRHSFATNWINNAEGDGDIEALLAVAGWKSRDMLKVYTSYRTETLIRAARRNASPKARPKVRSGDTRE